MSASSWPPRHGGFALEPHPRTPHSKPNRWIGIDLSGKNDPRRAGAIVPLLILVLATALGIAALRIDLIRVRYAVAEAMETEAGLIDEQRALTARRRQLRDPVALATQASERGFRSPDRTFVLPDPSRAAALPSVAAGVPNREARAEPETEQPATAPPGDTRP